MILEGTTADKMQSIYSRPHRNSINEPATIHDIPFEVLRESCLLLLKRVGSDLASPSLACRAWRVVALDLMNSRKRISKNNGRIEPFICGLHLQSIVGLERCTIKHLVLGISSIGKEFIHLISRVVAPNLSNLLLCCNGVDPSECYDALGVLFELCEGIRNLCLDEFDFGIDPAAISQIVKDGFGRLRQLSFVRCRGDIRMFVEITSIPNLRILEYWSVRKAAEEDEIVSSFASSYRTLTSVKLLAKFDSSASLLKVVECCRDLEMIVFDDRRGRLILQRSDILTISSLPRLKCLKIYGGGGIAEDADSALSRCRGLKSLKFPFLIDPYTLSAIGKNLVSLELWNPSKGVVDRIVESCPNLQYLVLERVWVEEDDLPGLKQTLKEGLKSLCKLKVNGESVHLGTDWEGYLVF
jgi:hypothetical protein